MKFIKKHPYLIIWLVALIVCIVVKVRFRWVALGTLVFWLIVALIHLPDTIAVLGYLVQSLFKKNDQAFRLYEWAFSHGAKKTTPEIAYGIQLLKRCRYQDALTHLQNVLVTPGLQPMLLKYVRQDLAIAYEKTGDVKTAISTLQTMEKDYDILSADFYTTLAYFYLQDGNFAKAEEANNKALKQDEACPGAYDNMAQMAYLKGDLDEAEELYKKALELKDTMVSSKFYLGKVYEAKGDIENAKLYYTAAHNCQITGMQTVTREEVDAKYQEFLSK